MKKLCYVATIPAVVHAFLRVHIQAAAEKYEVTVICNFADKHLLYGLNARFILLPIKRKPSPWRDMLILLQLYQIFRRERFNIVHSIMPKTGMLTMLAARLARVPIRIHTFTGQVWVTKQGVKSILLKWFDKLIANFATCVLADSPSQRDFLINQRVITQDKVIVIGAGSICGVDPLRFRPDSDVRRTTRDSLSIAQNSKVILFVGRLNRDKGILDLAAAFDMIAKHNPDTVLLLVGAEEDVLFSQVEEICYKELDHLRYVSFTSTPEHYMATADIFCLPSYREGFGMTIIEAAACGVPVVASRIYGITDAVAEGKTGLLFMAGDVDALTKALLNLIAENELRQCMGNAARVRTLELFPSEKISHKMMMLYDKLSEVL
jgi:glycosyltransferase involved in cell wall biosynthesis